MKIENIKFMGICQFHILLTFVDGTAALTNIKFDFSEPITQKVIDNLVEIIINDYEKKEQYVETIYFVDEDFVEKNQHMFNSNKVNYEWNNEEIKVNKSN